MERDSVCEKERERERGGGREIGEKGRRKVK